MTNARSLTWRRFNRALVGLMLASMAAVPVANVLVDPYGVFGTRLITDGSQLNERVVKARHLLARPRYDTLLLGSSVMGVVDPAAMGASAYNASFFAATPADMLAMVRLLDAHDRLPARLVIGLDPFLFAKPKSNVPQMRLPPEASGESHLKFWNDFLYASSAAAIVAKLHEVGDAHPGVAFDRATGRYFLPRLDAAREADPDGYVKRMVYEYRIERTSNWWDSASRDQLLEFDRFLKSRPGVAVTWVSAPIHPRLRPMLGEGLPWYHATVALVGPRVDLSDDPVIGRDGDWYEIKHIRGGPLTHVVAEKLRASVQLARRKE